MSVIKLRRSSHYSIHTLPNFIITNHTANINITHTNNPADNIQLTNVFMM